MQTRRITKNQRPQTPTMKVEMIGLGKLATVCGGKTRSVRVCHFGSILGETVEGYTPGVVPQVDDQGHVVVPGPNNRFFPVLEDRHHRGQPRVGSGDGYPSLPAAF